MRFIKNFLADSTVPIEMYSDFMKCIETFYNMRKIPLYAIAKEYNRVKYLADNKLLGEGKTQPEILVDGKQALDEPKETHD